MIHKETNDRTEGEIFRRWMKNKSNAHFFETHWIVKITQKHKQIKLGQYKNAFESYKKELENATLDELKEARYNLIDGIDPTGSINSSLSAVIGGFAGVVVSRIADGSNWSVALFGAPILIWICLQMYQPMRAYLQTFRLAVIEKRIEELLITDRNGCDKCKCCNSYDKLNNQDKCKRNNDSTSRKKKQKKGSKKSKQ